MRRALTLCALLAACGGRTISDDYRDAGAAIDRPSPPIDAPPPGDTPAPDDAPRPDTPAPADVPGLCPLPQVRCDGRCVSLDSDTRHCGACNRGCMGVCVLGACRPFTTMPVLGGPTFRVEALSGVGCQVAEHAEVTGDDRGGIAVMGSELLYTGDTVTGVFPVEALAMGRPGQGRFDGLVSDLRTGLAYTLAFQGAPFNLDDVPEGDGTVRFDSLLGIGPGGVLGAARIPLSRPLTVNLRGNNVGLYAGWGRMVIHDDVSMHHITLPEGVVTTVPFTSILPRARCESWANWGLAEYADDTLSLVYVEAGRRIARYNTRTGAITTVATFDGLSDMCSIVALPRRGRWAFHFEGGSQFGAGDELIGHCQGRFRFDN